MPRLAVARLAFFANSFNPVRTGRAAFCWQEGPEALATAPPGSDLAGLAAFLAARPDWRASVLCAAAAGGGGPMQSGAFGAWLGMVLDGLRGVRWDGVYLALHGAAQAEGDADADLTALSLVRAAIGRTPLVASLHWAANVSERTALLLDGAAVARGWPDADGEAAALRALALLEGTLSGRLRPVGALVRAPTLLPALAPQQVLPAMWANERSGLPPSVLEASLLAGFPWAEGSAAGPAALVWTDRDPALARAVAGRLAYRMGSLAAPLAALPSAEAALAGFAPTDRFALLDPADDPASGGLADTPGLLRALLAAPPVGRAAFGVLHDPAALAAAAAAGPGAEFARPLGAQHTGRFGPPVRIEGRVRQLAESPRCGRLAVLQCGRLQIVLAERRPARIDADLFAAAGVQLSRLRVLALKAGEAARASLAGAFAHIVACAAPGPAAALLPLAAFPRTPDRRPAARAGAGAARIH
jgi:microcystin degradation protein MlrC